jgi:fructan beta-fructosidase
MGALRTAAAIAGGWLLGCAVALPAATLGEEPLRPQIHFSPALHWMNDPNGLVYFEGEYHLFFQYNPQGEIWGHMSWGHAVSPDLVHWHELPLAIPEDERYMIFSGSIVVDTNNTSGFAQHGEPVLVAIYTGAQQPGSGQQSQQLAFPTCVVTRPNPLPISKTRFATSNCPLTSGIRRRACNFGWRHVGRSLRRS